MHKPSRRLIWLQRLFFGVGLFLLFLGRSVLETVSENLAAEFFPDEPARQLIFINAAALVSFSGALLCLLTGWGLHSGRRWARRVGICTSLILTVLFPIGTWAGILGLMGLSKPLETGESSPPEAAIARKSKDYWVSKKHSPMQKAVGAFLAMMALLCLGGVSGYSHQLGMQGWNFGWICLPLLLMLDVTVHESGHAAVAWAVGNRLRVVNIGPFTFRDQGRGYQFHFDWRHLFAARGFVNFTPLSDANLRLKLIAGIAGGPLAALLEALVMIAVFHLLPGTRFQVAWWFPGFLAVIGFFDFLVNLVPLGYCDGSMLFHLILWTRGGRLLVDHLVMSRWLDDLEMLRDQANHAQEAELAAKALERALAGGEGTARMIAICHSRLASARLAMEDWAGGEAESRKSLAHEAECAFENGLLVNGWSQIQRASFNRHHVAEVGRAYAPLVKALEERRKKIRDSVETAVTAIMMGCAHLRASDFGKALGEADAALRVLPPGPDRLILQSGAWSIRARAEFALGRTDSALASATRAAELLRSTEIPKAKRNYAWEDLGQLGADLFSEGEPTLSLELLREAVRELEAAGAMESAAQYRIKLAAAHRELGELEEARHCLPAEDSFSPTLVRILLVERARLHLGSGRPDAAIDDCRQLVPHQQCETAEDAVALSLLAQAHLETGDFPQAANLARQAADVLGPWGHYETARCLIVLALGESRAGGEWNPAYADQARRLIESDLLLRPTSKSRLLASHDALLKRYATEPAVSIS